MIPKELSYGEFYRILQTNKDSKLIESAVKVEDQVKGVFSNGSRFLVHLPQLDSEMLNLMRDNVPNFDVKPPRTFLANLFYSLGPMILFIVFLWFFVYRGAAAQGGGKILSFGKSRAR